MLELFLMLLPFILTFALGLVIGWAIGVARVNWPLINWFRSYYARRAEERMRQHTQFLIAQVNLFGAVAVSHRSAGARASQGGRHGSRLSLQQPLHKGGDAQDKSTDTFSVIDCYVPSTGARLPIERP